MHMQPHASRSEVVGTHGTAPNVRVHAPPLEGAANDAVICLLSVQLGVPRRAARSLTGTASRARTVDIESTTDAAARALAMGGDETN